MQHIFTRGRFQYIAARRAASQSKLAGIVVVSFENALWSSYAGRRNNEARRWSFPEVEVEGALRLNPKACSKCRQ